MRGLPVALPLLGWMRIVVAKALDADVALQGGAIGGSKGLGPVASLPDQAMGEQSTMVDVVRRRALESLHDDGERDGGSELKEEMNMVRSAPHGHVPKA